MPFNTHPRTPIILCNNLQSLRTHGLVLHPPCTLYSFVGSRLKQDTASSRSQTVLVAAAGGQPLTRVLAPPQHQKTSVRVSDDVTSASVESREEEGAAGGSQQPCDEQQLPPIQSEHEYVLLVGPEGDWSPEELEGLVKVGAVPVGLGRLRLRTETAAIALLAAVSNHCTS